MNKTESVNLDEIIVVRMLKRYDVYNVGELAGFQARIAARLIKKGGAVAVRPKGFDPDRVIEATRDQPNGPAEEVQLKRNQIIQAFSVCGQEDREKDGRPKLESLLDILGFAVSVAERDKCWEIEETKRVAAERELAERARAARVQQQAAGAAA